MRRCATEGTEGSSAAASDVYKVQTKPSGAGCRVWVYESEERVRVEFGWGGNPENMKSVGLIHVLVNVADDIHC